ncbi:MAG TPA: phospholipase D-like domain-containing protein [Kofleriaceae bacterium]|jgi:phosphatidylserine/phosphatidylglycerophosphate/cardiolipin synthase-like enzyme|nr:phospholipase D-like domain-containing protein [Kofleriaceae bacterium]
MLRPPTLAVFAVLALLVLAALALAACASARAPQPPAAPWPTAPPGFELVESVPIETMLDHPDLRDASDVWLEMIAGARSSIDLAQFYASNHQPSRLESIVQALEAAATRGVRIRFLAEQSFVKTYADTLDRLAHAGASIRHCDLKATTGGILHAKFFVVDGHDAFFGSQNFDWRALEHNYELGARMRDPALVGGLAAISAADWARAGGEPVPDAHAPPAHGPITLVASPASLLPAGVPWDLPRIVELLDGATTHITVEALGYRADADGTPWDELEAPLVRAAQRGVQVELLFADWSKRSKTIGGLQKLARIPNIFVRLTTIPPWSGGFIPFARVSHAKALVVDGKRAWLGTSNWEKDYFTRGRNVGVIIEDPALAAQLTTFFTTLWQSPYATPVDPDATYTPPRIE